MDFPTIALLTDFGERDGFVGVMKGVIYSKLDNPVPVVDISHGVAPQDIRHGMWILENALSYFPPKTIFVTIVDPGVGGASQASLLCYWPKRNQVFIAPDNGLLTPVFEHPEAEGLYVYDIRNASFYRDDTLSLHGRSQTFHGRDVYAPLAALTANAYLKDALPNFLGQLGPTTPQVTHIQRHPPSCTAADNAIACQGEIAACDTFGNLITNIPQAWIVTGSLLSVQIGENPAFLCPYFPHYAAVVTSDYPDSQVVAVPSSGGTIELSVYQGNAASLLQASPFDAILIKTVP